MLPAGLILPRPSIGRKWHMSLARCELTDAECPHTLLGKGMNAQNAGKNSGYQMQSIDSPNDQDSTTFTVLDPGKSG